MVSISPTKNQPHSHQSTYQTTKITHHTKNSHSTQLPHDNSLSPNNTNRFQVYEIWHHQKQQSQIINNRIKYLQTQQQKQNRILELAKKKYQQIKQTRTWSNQQKNHFRKIIQLNHQASQRDAIESASRVKQERIKKDLSVSRVKELHEQQAKQLRHQHIQNQNYIRQSRTLEVKTNRDIVNKIHQQNQQSKSHLKQIYRERVIAGKSCHRSYLQDHIERNNKWRKKNSFLRLKLQKSLDTAQQTSEQFRGSIIKYSKLMTPKLSLTLHSAFPKLP